MHDTLTSSACACAQAEAFAETLGTLPRLTAAQPAHAVVIARDAFVIGTDAQRCEFEVVLTRPAVSIHDASLLQARSSIMLYFKCSISNTLGAQDKYSPCCHSGWRVNAQKAC